MDQKFWGFGMGFSGCLFDHQEVIGTFDEALDAACELYELTPNERHELKQDKIVRFDQSRKQEQGFSDLIELFETSELPESIREERAAVSRAYVDHTRGVIERAAARKEQAMREKLDRTTEW